jgi:DNA modification methylase
MQIELKTGDNLTIMKEYITSNGEGLVDLIYIDPPFNSGRDYKNSKTGEVEFTDIWIKPHGLVVEII